MAKRINRRRAVSFVTVLMSFIIAAGLIPATEHAYAAGSPKMTVYDQVIRKGNIVYCGGLGRNLYKVNLKTGKVYDLYTGRIVQPVEDRGQGYAPYYLFSSIHSMRLKGKYLYYVWPVSQPGTRTSLYRIHTKTGKVQRLARAGTGGRVWYVIKGNRIYVKLETSMQSYKYKYRVMKLNGKSVKKTSVKPKMKTLKSNINGYKVRIKDINENLGAPYFDVRETLIARNRNILLRRTIGYEVY